jgi:DNA-binding FrmR family transcriptional regulator
MFEAYLRMIESDASFSTITQRFMIMKKTMNEIKRSVITRQVNDALNTRNESSTAFLHDLSLNSSVLIFRENTENNHSDA